MPIVKKNKGLDGANSIYSASRKLAARQLRNMKAPAMDDGETSTPQNPIPTSSNTEDSEGLVPQLLQNLNDVNGLMSSLRLVGGKSKKGVPHTPQAFDDDDDEDVVPGKRPKRGGASPLEIAKLKQKIAREQNRMKDAEAKIREYETTPQSDPAYAKARIEYYENEVRLAKNGIKRFQKELLKLENEPDNAPQPVQPEAERLGRRLNTLLEFAKVNGYLEDEEGATELLERLNRIHADIGLPILRITDRFDLEAVGPGGAEGDPIPLPDPRPLPPIVRPGDIEADDGDDGGDEEIDISNFDFSKVSKSTLLVILNQLKSLVKKGDILLKKIVHSNVEASEGDLDQITQEVSSLISSKRFLLSHINQISSKGREIAEYLYSILSNMVGKYIENLKTYVKRYAQLNREQINSIQEDNAEVVANEAGAGRPSPSVGRHEIILPDAIKRISGFSRKYLL
jgi:hypothetical protein